MYASWWCSTQLLLWLSGHLEVCVLLSETPVLWLISYMLLVCVVEALSWQSDVSKPCTIPKSLQTLFLFLQDHSVKLKGVCAVHVLAASL